ncbi:uncharacterized protein LOC116606244 [Nematostella vectensis]|uniref:uncharacterized protein LOC116606244 n=1 Tax=Nematostella vectensis TaxID=45351 RepID=UPI0020779453|nr:uncharacterized protein LOC116606244 [Nematostella vectensis]
MFQGRMNSSWTLAKRFSQKGFYLMAVCILEVKLICDSNACRVVEFMKCVGNKSLTAHHVLRSMSTDPDPDLCEIQCFAEQSCFTYNLGPVDATGHRKCELNFADLLTNGANLENRPGFSYCSVKNPCGSSLCPEGRECYPLMDNFVGEYVCMEACSTGKPLGLENRDIPDSAMTASSSYQHSVSHEPSNGRLHYNKYSQAWCAGGYRTRGAANQGRDSRQGKLRPVGHIVRVEPQSGWSSLDSLLR